MVIELQVIKLQSKENFHGQFKNKEEQSKQINFCSTNEVYDRSLKFSILADS